MALISGIIQHLYFYHWFVSLTAMSSEFIHVEAYVRIFSPYWRLKIFHCIYLLYFVYLFIWQLLFSCSAVFYCLWPHGLQLTRPPCPSPSPRACSNSCPSSWWCHPTISSSVVFFSCLQAFQNPDLFQWVSSLYQVAKVVKLQHQSNIHWKQWIFRTDFL